MGIDIARLLHLFKTDSLGFIDMAITVLLDQTDVKTFLEMLYTYVQRHPDKAQKLYQMFRAGVMLLERIGAGSGDRAGEAADSIE